MEDFVRLMTADRRLALALGKAIPSKDVQTLAECLAKVFEYNNKTVWLIEALITSEIDATPETAAGTLFRTNSIASKVMTLWSRMGEGRQYLKETISAPILAVCSNKFGSLEVNPEHARPEDDVVANMAQLNAIVQEVLDCILTSVPRCPRSFRVVCAALRNSCTDKFASSALMVVGAFIILRYFSAALVTPETNGLLDEAPGLDARRILVLVSKTVQNLANRTWFRETYMDTLNKFLEANLDRMNSFLEEVSQIPSGDPLPPPPTTTTASEGGGKANVKQEDYEEALKQLMGELCAKNIKFLEQHIPDPDVASRKVLVEMVRAAITKYGQQTGTDLFNSNGGVTPAVPVPLDPKKAKEEKKKKEKELKEELKKQKEAALKNSKRGKVDEAEAARARAQAEALLVEQLISAGASGNVAVIEEILSREKRLVNGKDRDEQTALHHACTNGHVAAVRALLKWKADCYLADKRGWTALHCAAVRSQEEVLEELTKQRHIDFSSKNDDGNTPLHYLARNPCTKSTEHFVKLFVNGGADVNSQNCNCETPLHMAVWKNNPGMISLLFDSGADPKSPNTKGETPWDWAVKLKNPDIIQIFEKAIKQRALSQSASNSASSATAPIRRLFPQLQDSTHRYRAFLDAVKDNQIEIVREVLKIDRKLAETPFGVSKFTALHVAAIQGHFQICKLLLRYATKLVKNAAGWTPLMCALWQGHEDIAMLIILSKHAPDVTATLADGNTALHLAARHSAQWCEMAIFTLIEHGADINATNANGDTPLHSAVLGGRLDAVRQLLEAGANRNKPNRDKETPADLAQKLCNGPILNMLLDRAIESTPPATDHSPILHSSSPVPSMQPPAVPQPSTSPTVPSSPTRFSLLQNCETTLTQLQKRCSALSATNSSKMELEGFIRMKSILEKHIICPSGTLTTTSTSLDTEESITQQLADAGRRLQDCADALRKPATELNGMSRILDTALAALGVTIPPPKFN